MEYVLQTRDMTKQYKKKLAVDHVSINVPKGSIYGLVGENGAGKTTIMKTVVGLIKETGGNYELFGSSDILAQRKKIGCVIENPALFMNMTAKDNLIAFSKMMGITDYSEVDKILELIGLKGEKKKAKAFSLGMKQRLSIGVALLGNPEFLILDEPINGLDPAGIAAIRNLLLDLRKSGKTILISSHILSELFKIATDYGIIHKGKLVGEYTEEALMNLTSTSLRIVADDYNKAISVIKEKFGINASYNELERCIIIGDSKASAAEINMALCTAGVMVSELVTKKDDLENYIIGIMQGGEKDA